MRSVFLSIALVLSPLFAAAATTGEEDTIVINRLNQTDFEVMQGTNFGAAEFWCGAATYIERRRAQSELTVIFVKRPRGPSLNNPGQNSVIFTTNPAGLAQAGSQLTLSVQQKGVMLKSGQARRYCRDAFTRSTK